MWHIDAELLKSCLGLPSRTTTLLGGEVVKHRLRAAE